MPAQVRAQQHMKLSLGDGNPTTAAEDKHGNSAVPEYVGQHWGLGSESYMVWWLHSFYKLQQWPAFSVTVVARPGQSPFSPSLLSRCSNWTSIVSQREVTTVVVEMKKYKTKYLYIYTYINIA